MFGFKCCCALIATCYCLLLIRIKFGIYFVIFFGCWKWKRRNELAYELLLTQPPSLHSKCRILTSAPREKNMLASWLAAGCCRCWNYMRSFDNNYNCFGQSKANNRLAECGLAQTSHGLNRNTTIQKNNEWEWQYQICITHIPNCRWYLNFF